MAPDAPSRTRQGAPLNIIVTSVSSDAHTWNLVYLQLMLEELGHEVTNLGACVPDAELVAGCAALGPDLIVVSSVNGHGGRDGLRLIRALRDDPALATTPVVIGGKLDIRGGDPAVAARLRAAGFDAVFAEGAPTTAFHKFVAALSHADARLAGVR